MNQIIQDTIKNLNSHNVHGYFAPDSLELFRLLTKLIPEGSKVGCGDSLTLEQLGVFDFLRSGNFEFLDKHVPTLTSAQKREIYLKNFRADVFISGVNAISRDGKVVNIDGNGSRVAPMIYGPPKVILIAGTNKLTKTEEQATWRARHIAGPMDAKRLGRKTPCAVTGNCTDCCSPDRICNDFVVIARQFDKERMHVIIVEGEYGY